MWDGFHVSRKGIRIGSCHTFQTLNFGNWNTGIPNSLNMIMHFEHVVHHLLHSPAAKSQSRKDRAYIDAPPNNSKLIILSLSLSLPPEKLRCKFKPSSPSLPSTAPTPHPLSLQSFIHTSPHLQPLPFRLLRYLSRRGALPGNQQQPSIVLQSPDLVI